MNHPTQHRARKRFGQHFLHDKTMIGRIIDAIRPLPGEHVVEIGPGLGALTDPLLRTGILLTAVEIDRDLAQRLRDTYAGDERFTLIESDVLKAPLDAIQPRPLRLVGNLPYNISTPLIFRLLDLPEVRDMHFMLQKEVVDRLIASPGSSDYGRLSVMAAAKAQAQSVLRVAPGAFSPPPKVDSAVVRLIPRTPDFVVPPGDAFDQVVRLAFSARRKTLANGLKPVLTREQIGACDVDPGIRPEQVTPAQFAQLAGVVAAQNQTR
ncbi:16S rRNA (adenine(1518)-N(6)/adenine(1519)-N(6))-dimethyltransferase RsmA [Abyssibacter sp.]|uniref:16S rRNA (adenine(1518)-N(6)/adenine(1519)-N(6))- dimethyltransferase RsmA n=1 Tax=Abyssibacter sp. TaxID=2320200 RepID=UPI0035188FF5